MWGQVGKGSKRTGGFSLVEVIIATVLVVVGLGGLTQSVGSSIQLSRVNAERSAAEDAGQRMVGVLRSTDFEDIFATFNTSPLDDPAGAGSAVGESFDVDGLRAQSTDADGFAGQVIFPTELAVGTGGLQLREDTVDSSLGMPRDLNGDSMIAFDNLDHSGDYIVLPIKLRIQWQGVAGDCSLEINLILTE